MGWDSDYGMRSLSNKETYFGKDTKGHDIKIFGDTTGKYMMWDASANTLYVVGTLDLTGTFNSGNLALIDNETITMGTGLDINFKFDGTNLLWSKTVAAGNALKIDADTVDTTSDVFALDVGVNSAAVSAAKINLDVGTALSAGEIAKGIYIDANGIASNADTSGLYGVDVLLTATSTDRADIIGYKVAVDGTMDTADTIKGILVDLDATLSTSTLYGLHIDGSGLTHTNATLYGIYNDVSATVTAGTSVAEFIKLSAAATGISIDGGTIDSTAGNAITINWDVNSSNSNMINATVDVGTALSAGEVIKGLFFDINGIAANADTSGIYGIDLLMTATSTDRADLVGYKLVVDGTMDGADTIKGSLIDFDCTINTPTAYGQHIDLSGVTHTDGTLYGQYIQLPSATAGTSTAQYINCGANTTAIYINSGSTDRTANNCIEIDLDVNDASVSMIKGFMDWGTASTTAKTVRGLFLDFDDIASGFNGSGLIGCHMLMSGIASGNSDLVGYKTEFDGTRNQGDTAKGIHIIQNTLTINHASEYLYGSHIDFSSLTHTNGIVYGEYIDVSANVASGSNYGTYIKCAAGSNSAIYIDRGTNDVTTGNAIDIDFDVNSASVNCINVDLDVGTALSSAESVVGLKLDLVGNAGDATDSTITGIYMTNAGTGTGVNKAINIDGTWDRSIEIESTAGRAEIDVEIDNAYKVVMFEDFFMPVINENDFPVILNNDGGGGADPSIAAVVARGALTCNTTAGGGANGSQVVISLPVTANLGGLVFETSLHINTAITGCRVLAGFTDVSTWEVGASIGGGDAITTTFSDGCAFVYDDQADTDVWFAVGVAGDTDATGNGATDTAPVADTYQTLRIEISADGSTAYFYINDVLKKTLTANAITASTAAYATVVIQETAAAAKTIDIDYIKLVHNR